MYRNDLINEAMGRTRMTNEKLAKAVGVSAPTISAVRNGKWNGKHSLLGKIAEVLQISIEDLVREKEAA